VLVGISQQSPAFFATFISAPEQNSGTRSSDAASRSFTVQQVAGLLPGYAIVDMDGSVLGMWDGSSVIPANMLKFATTSYFANAGNIVRPLFGFTYRFISEAEGKLIAAPAGARVVATEEAPAVVPGSPADKAGLREGDTITEIAGNKVTQDAHVEQYLEKFKPGDSVQLTVIRGTETVAITLQAGQLK
jgi:S1-C subfamily serine protease